MGKSRARKRQERRRFTRPEELLEFLLEVGLGTRNATRRELEEAVEELTGYLAELDRLRSARRH